MASDFAVNFTSTGAEVGSAFGALGEVMKRDLSAFLDLTRTLAAAHRFSGASFQTAIRRREALRLRGAFP